MTYCVAMRLDAGLLFASDSRTNAGVDHIATFRKMNIFEVPGERLITLLSAGNLATTQSVVSLLRQRLAHKGTPEGEHLFNRASMYDVAELVGRTVKETVARDANAESLDGETTLSFSPSYSFALNDDVGLFAEAGYTRTRHLPDDVVAGGGVTWMVAPTVQLDLSANVGLTSDSTDLQAGFGVSVFFP